jgi:hypothetical protein
MLLCLLVQNEMWEERRELRGRTVFGDIMFQCKAFVFVALQF